MPTRGPLNNPRGGIPRRRYSQRGSGLSGHTPRTQPEPVKPAPFVAPGRTRPRSERVKVEKPIREAKRQRAIRAMSDQAQAMLSIIKDRTVYRNRDGSGHYWQDRFMQAVGYIDKAILTELRKLKLIREQAGLFVAKAAA